jgi:hypothetical protein
LSNFTDTPICVFPVDLTIINNYDTPHNVRLSLSSIDRVCETSGYSSLSLCFPTTFTSVPYFSLYRSSIINVRRKRRVRTLDGNPANRTTGHPSPVTFEQGIFFKYFFGFFVFFGIFFKKNVSLSVSFFLVVHVF